MPTQDTLVLLDDLITKALAAGADAADAIMSQSDSLSVGRRLDKPERLERSESVDLGLRVLIGKRQAVVSCNDLKPATLAGIVDRAMAMAKAVPEDPYSGIAEPEQLATDWPELDLCDAFEPSAEQLIDMARRAEAAGRAVPGITNSEGADAGWSRMTMTLAASNGFAQRTRKSRFSTSVALLAGEGTGMERDYEYSSKIHMADLMEPEEIGRLAAEATLKRLNPRKIETARVPVVFDRRVASGLLGSLAGAISGSSVARGVTFLKDSLGKQIFPASVTIWDDPFIPRGLRSRPFDGEGIQPIRRPMVHDGYLNSWIMDLRSSRQLGLVSTGHAARGTGGPPTPSPTNFHFQPGAISREDMLRQIGTGLYVTETMGHGGSLVTGDYSEGASGYWIENGQLTYPVSEITIAGNLRDMFMHLTVANDLEHRYGIDSPTIAIEGMTIAGR